MPSAILSERDTAVPNRFFFSSNHPFCFVLLCFSMPHSVAYCVSIHASSWYFRHRKMMARSTVWLLRIHMMRGDMARLRQHSSIPGRTCRVAFLLVPVRVAIGNGTCGDAAMVRRWYYVLWLWGAPAIYASVALDDPIYRNAAQEGCRWRRTQDDHFPTCRPPCASLQLEGRPRTIT